MNQVIILELGDINKIYPVLISDQQELILIDCGYPDFYSVIKDAANQKNINIERLTKIIITHHDFDHMGALAEFKGQYPNVQIISSVEEEKYINGKEKSLRLKQAEALYDSLPDSQKENAQKFHELLKSIRNVNVDLTVKDGERFSWCGGVEIVSTPGHMPGHICVYLRESKTLIAGDAMVVEDGELCVANPQYTLDMKAAKESIGKLLNYDIEKIICYHGGVYTKDIKQALEKIYKS